MHDVRGRAAAGVIVEVEAYIGEADPACHAAPGPTLRNAPLYGAPGQAYVYLNYGLHCLMNVVTEPVGSPAALLIRALEPTEGLGVMASRRRRARAGRLARSTRGAAHGRPIAAADLCRGPGNLTVALGIDLRHNRADLAHGALRIEDRRISPGQIVWSPRIGISVGADRPWRCSVAGHPSVSGPRRSVD